MDDNQNKAQPATPGTAADGQSAGPALNLVEEEAPPSLPSAKVNLLGHEESGQILASAEPVNAEDKPKRNDWRPKLMVAFIAALVILALGTGSFLVLSKQKTPKTAGITPKPTPPPVPAPVAKPQPAPPPPPPPPPVAQTVTAPAVTPTSDHPQTVIVQSKSGLWLRSTPDSSSRSNIVGWMPNGASVSVDQASGFWWHGTYKGTAGYFASNYTQ